jgi:hypothetical protein
MTFKMTHYVLAVAVIATGSLVAQPALGADSQSTSGSIQDGNSLMRFPDLRSTAPIPAQPSEAPLLVPQSNTFDDHMRAAPLAWRASAYNLATNKLTARTKWTVPVTFDKTKSYLEAALAQLGFSIRSAYPQAGQFLVAPAQNAQIIIVAQPTSEGETALQMIVTGDTRALDQQKVQQIPQMMLMVIQRKGLL